MLAYIFQRLDSIVSSLFSFEHNELVGKNVTYLLNEINVEKENTMATVSAKVFEHHKKADGTYNVKICVQHKRLRKYLDTTHFVVKKQST